MDGCDDVDFSFTPATNLLPIRRLRLAEGARTGVRAAWLAFPALELEPLEQVYAHLDGGRYRYESEGGFTADLENPTRRFRRRGKATSGSSRPARNPR